MALFDTLQEQVRNVQAPAPSGEFSDINQLFQGPRTAQLLSAIGGASSQAAGVDLKHKADVADYQRQSKIDALELQQAANSKRKAKAQDYTRTLNERGGFDFFGPDGTPISPYAYARAKGSSLSNVLEGTADPQQEKVKKAIKFATEFPALAQSVDPNLLKEKTLKDILARGDKAGSNIKSKLSQEELTAYKYGKIIQSQPQLAKATPQQLVQAIVQTYPEQFSQVPEFSPESYTEGLPQGFQTPGIQPEAKNPNLLQRLMSALGR